MERSKFNTSSHLVENVCQSNILLFSSGTILLQENIIINFSQLMELFSWGGRTGTKKSLFNKYLFFN